MPERVSRKLFSGKESLMREGEQGRDLVGGKGPGKKGGVRNLEEGRSWIEM